ncbi:MAG TPA: ROK family protein [Acidimicrobiia bacterium]
MDLGGTKLLAVRLDGDAVVDERRSSNPSGRVPIVDALATAIGEVLTDDVDAIGVGIAGLVEWPEGIFVWGPHVAGTGLHLRSHLEEAFGLPTVVDNDANTGAHAEHTRGSARGYDHVVFVTLGTGIGGALIVDGRIYRGGSFAGEWGHTMFERNGERCACGKRGCGETVASAHALERLATDFVTRNPGGTLAARLGEAAITGQGVIRAADEGDETARGLVAQVGIDLGLGLCNLIAALDPQIVVVGGGLGSVGESLLGPARRAAADALHGGSHRMLPPIVVADHGPAAGAIGAAMMAFDLVDGRLELEVGT